MRQSKKFLVPLLLLAGMVGFASLSRTSETALSEGAADWHTDFSAAKAIAQSEGKPLLLYFTGSDWCPPCIALNRDVFSQPAFADYAEEALVLVKADFPRAKPQSEELVAQNERLIKEFGRRGFPAILLLSPEGDLIGSTGYRSGGAEAYVQHLRALLAAGE